MRVFDLKSFFESDGDAETAAVEIGGMSFLLRPLDGIESEEYGGLPNQTERAVWLLSHGLIDGATRECVSREGARRLFARHQPLALELARRILDLTESVWREEARRLEEAKKNSPGPPTPGCGANTAGGTGSTR